MLLSICVPVFNRPKEVEELIYSIMNQSFEDLEIILCEDDSPERNELREVIRALQIKYGSEKIKYFENETNLGYDANLRNSIDHARGDYVILSGNDDLFAPNSLSIIEKKINHYAPDVLVRSFESFGKNIGSKNYIHRYVNKDTPFVNSQKDLAMLFYRSVLVSGLVIKRELAIKFATNKVDGTLYYQNYLIGMISQKGTIYYLPDCLVHCRIIGYADFGSSLTEKKGEWEPGKRTIESSIYQMKMFFQCASHLEDDMGSEFLFYLKKIASAYSFTVLSYHRDKGIIKFLHYVNELRKIGYSGMYFYIYIFVLLLIGEKSSAKILDLLKRIFGKTPKLV